MTQQDRAPAGVRGFHEVIAAAQLPAGAGPAITIIVLTAMSRAPARPASMPSPTQN